MDYITLGIILIGFAGLGAFVYVLLKKNAPQDVGQSVESKINELLPKILEANNEQLKSTTSQLITMSEEKLGAQKKNIESEMTNKKEVIEGMVKRLEEELKNTNQRLETAERDRIGSFRELRGALENQKTLTEKLSVTTDNLRKVLSNNQLRGKFGEQVAEDLLKMAGFVINIDYLSQKKNVENENKPDFTILLPDQLKINVDVKFPFANLQRLIECEDEQNKEPLRKLFESDVKTKIKQIATRDYINPEENTVDFAIMFIPNEMIFSYIYEHMPDTWQYALENKIQLVGPFSFTAMLRLVRQSYTYYQYQKDVYKMINLIKVFEKEFEKYNVEFEKIGDRIMGLEKQYNEVNATRTNKLMRTIEKVKLEEETQDKLL